MNYSLRILLVAMALLPLGCGPAFSPPPPTSIRPTTSVAKEILQRGYDVHQAKCANCHSFQNPANFEVANLKTRIIPDMAKKAKLSEVDTQALTAYLLAVRGNP